LDRGTVHDYLAAGRGVRDVSGGPRFAHNQAGQSFQADRPSLTAPRSVRPSGPGGGLFESVAR